MLRGFFDSFKPQEQTIGVAPPSSAAFHADEKTNGPVKGTDNGGAFSRSSSDIEKGADGNREHHEYAEAAPVGTAGAAVVVNERGTQLTTADSGLKRSLHNRHMQMIAMGGAIGTGLFIGSGGALSTGGPGFLIIDFCIVGILLAPTILGLGELATVLPVAGSFAAYSNRFIDPAWGFAVGWNYFMEWFVTIPLEIVASVILIGYWDPNETVPQGVWVTIFILVIAFINLFGVRGYGEFEFAASFIKIIAIIGFIIAGIVINAGGAPSGEYLGAATWQGGLAFQNGFKGFCSVFVTAAFAFSGAELMGFAAAETDNPRKAVPKASKQVFYRIFLFFVVSLTVITFIVPCNDERLTGGTSDYDARASPFVIALDIGRIKVLPSILNAVILISALSVGNASVFGASRTLCALAQSGQAPKIFAYIDRKGRPLPATLVCIAFGAFAYIIYSASQNDVFYWLLSLAGLATIIVWGSVNLCHIRFRQAWARSGRTLEELPWKSPMGVWGSWLALFLNIIVLIAQFYKAGWPIGEAEKTSSERAVNFFQSFLAAPIMIVFYIIGWFVVPGAGWIPMSQIDCTTGRREAPSLEELRQERAEIAAMPFWKRILNDIF